MLIIILFSHLSNGGMFHTSSWAVLGNNYTKSYDNNVIAQF